MRQMAATPPATERPMIVDVPTPLLLVESSPVSLGALAVGEGGGGVTVTNTTDCWPFASVTTELVTKGVGSG